MNTNNTKRIKLSPEELLESNSSYSKGYSSTSTSNTNDSVVEDFEPTDTSVEYLALSNQIVLDNIMSYLCYKDVQRLSACCRTLRELSTIEFERRKNGTSSNYLLFRTKNLTSEAFFRHPKSGTMADVHMGAEETQHILSEAINQLRFRPTVAFLLTGNVPSEEHRKWTTWLKHKLPENCTILNILSKTAICGSIDKHVYEVHQDKKINTCGMSYLFFGAPPPSCDILVFRSLKELVSLTEKETGQNEPVKCILYFSRVHSRKQLSKILSVCKEQNDNLSIAFGGLVVDSLASFVAGDYTSKMECAGLIFRGTDIKAASTIIEGMTNDEIRKSMIQFRDSIPFDINDMNKNTMCILLSCIEHSPEVNYSSDYTDSESDIFHTIFPSNIRTFGISGHGEYGQLSNATEVSRKIAYQFSCVMVLVQLPKK